MPKWNPQFRLFLVFVAGAFLSSTASAIDPVKIDAFLDAHCYDCHDDLTAEAGLNLLDVGFEVSNPRDYHTWSTIFRRVSKGEMPPKEKDRPEAEALDLFLAEVTDSLIEVERDRIASNGRAMIRRLSSSEYENSLRDLLALPYMSIKEALPPEGSAHGYDKSAEALDFSHIHASRLLEVADEALLKAVAPVAEKPERKKVRFTVSDPENIKNTINGMYALLKQSKAMPLVGMEVDKTVRLKKGNFEKRDPGVATDQPPHFDSLALFINGEFNLGMAIRPFQVEVPGYYVIRVNGFGIRNELGELVPSDRTETVGFYSNDRTLGFVDLPPYEPTTVELRVWMEQGDRVKPLVASAPFPKISLQDRAGPGKVVKPENYVYKKLESYGVAFRWFEFEGPYYDEWPPESHKRLFGDLPIVPEVIPGDRREPDKVVVGDIQTSEKVEDDARRLIRRFLFQSLRRPITPKDLGIPMSVVKRKMKQGYTFKDSLLAGYRAILTSPDFLLLQGEPGPLSDFALAERLSYFLWNSPPDGALRKRAIDGELSDSAVMASEVERMLKHPKTERFAKHFLNKWLKLEDIALTEPDANLYPDYTPLLMDSSLWESKAFFQEMISKDLPARNVIDSDFVMVNQRLAELYDLEGVYGNEIRRVELPDDSVRGGFLTQASVLKTTANGTVTSPVVRGDYVQVHFLGDPPPPPPPAVPAVEPDISGLTTIRDQLARHSEDQSCATCHAKIDPPGFALESFDVMGGFRDRYRSIEEGDPLENLFFEGRPAQTKEALPVDSAGVLYTGGAFKDINGFRAAVLENEEQVARNLLEQLLIYSTGAPIGFADKETIDAMMVELEPSEYGLRSMIHAIVQSPLFTHK
ncbi:MAG: DUF1592 domain-containing protein [Verrucomicrobiota bacterium]